MFPMKEVEEIVTEIVDPDDVASMRVAAVLEEKVLPVIENEKAEVA